MIKRTLTLDIKDHGIDWVLLHTGLRKVAIEQSGQLICHCDADDPAEAIAALTALRESLDVSGLACIAAITGRGLLARSLRVPFQDRRKVRQILPLELEASLPLSVDELLVDFNIVTNGAGCAALSAALPRTRIEHYRQLLQAAGLDPVLVTFAGLPTAALLAAGPDGGPTVLLIDGDHAHSMFFVIGGHDLLFLRSWQPPTAQKDPADQLKGAVDQTIEACAHVFPDKPPLTAVYLTPRGARHYDADRVAVALDLPVKVFRLPPSDRDHVTGELPGGYGQGALALGLYAPLADKGLNFLRTAFRLKRLMEQHRGQLVRIGILAVLLLAITLTAVFLDIRRHEKRARTLRSQAETILKETFPETRNIVNPLQQMIVNLREARSDRLAAAHGTRAAKIDILNAISQALPPELDIHVTQLVAGTDRVQISGTTDTFEAVNAAKRHLEDNAVFTNLTIVAANMDQRAGRVRFKITADLANRL